MVRISIATAAAAALLAASLSSASIVHGQSPIQLKVDLNETPSLPATPPTVPRKLHGRFLHITDIHPDSYYKQGGDPSTKCHRGKGQAGHWGAERSSCDTPWTLVDETFQWIKENLKDQIDFVVWTGDSARHDGDEKIARTPEEIYESNRKVVSRMYDVFGNASAIDNQYTIPIVPTLGNNDIFPHNIMLPGPSTVTKEYVELWKPFIPEVQFHIFSKGAYYWQQVVPGRNGKTGPGSEGGLAIFSLNTLYFFDSNTAVDGCDAKTEPGYEQFEWLDAQLSLMRERGMKAILIGHVPPAWTRAKKSWDKSCWKKYVLWSRQYRDVIVGHLYGHMNLDHFMLLDSHSLKPPHMKHPKKGGKGKKGKSATEALDSSAVNASMTAMCTIQDFNPEDNPVSSISSAETYLSSLREAFAGMVAPQQDIVDGVDAVNDSKQLKELIGGKWAERYILTHVGPSIVPNYFPTLRVMEYNITGLVDDQGMLCVEPDSQLPVDTNRNKKKKEKQRKPEPPAKTAPPGPAYSMQPFSFVGYTQYFLNLTKYNAIAAGKKKDHSTELLPSDELRKREVEEAKNGKAKINFEVEYDTRTDKVYKMKDLTVRSYVKLARNIVDSSSRGAKKKAKKGKKDPAPTDLVEDSDYDAEFEEFFAGEEPEDVDEELEDVDEELEDVDEEPEDVDKDDTPADADKKGKKGNKGKGKKGKGKKGKGKKGRKARDKVWHAFVKRAFVGTVQGEELQRFEAVRAQCAAVGL